MKLYDQNLSVLILAGGRGTRMNGADKGLIKVHGKFIIEYLSVINIFMNWGSKSKDKFKYWLREDFKLEKNKE